MIGVQRASFYGDVADGLYTGTIIDHGVARSFGQLSGLAASFGVFVQDISGLIDDPYAVVEGLQALVAIIEEQGLATVETIVQSYAQQVEQTQARNNPYGTLDEKQHPQLYDTFRANWYEGYAAGFLAKLVLGGAAWKSAKGAIKGTDSFQAVSSVVADTRTFRVLRQVQHAKNRLKARTTARLLLQFDDAPSGLLRQADTAGEAFHVWRVSRKLDVDVDALPDARQQRVHSILRRHGTGGTKLLNELDDGARDALLGADRGTADVIVATARHTDFDASRFLTRTDAEGVELVSRLDEGTATRVLLRYAEGDIDASHVGRLNRMLDEGEMDAADVQQMMGMLETKQTNPFVSDTITLDALFTIGKRGDLSDTRMVTMDGNGDVRWLEFNEGETAGLHKIIQKHEDRFYEQYSSVTERTDITRAIREAIEKSDSDKVKIRPNPGGGKRYYYKLENDAHPVRVSTSNNGFVLSAHPDEDAAGMFQ